MKSKRKNKKTKWIICIVGLLLFIVVILVFIKPQPVLNNQKHTVTVTTPTPEPSAVVEKLDSKRNKITLPKYGVNFDVPSMYSRVVQYHPDYPIAIYSSDFHIPQGSQPGKGTSFQIIIRDPWKGFDNDVNTLERNRTVLTKGIDSSFFSIGNPLIVPESSRFYVFQGTTSMKYIADIKFPTGNGMQIECNDMDPISFYPYCRDLLSMIIATLAFDK